MTEYSVYYIRVFVNNRVRYNRVSLNRDQHIWNTGHLYWKINLWMISFPSSSLFNLSSACEPISFADIPFSFPILLNLKIQNRFIKMARTCKFFFIRVLSCCTFVIVNGVNFDHVCIPLTGISSNVKYEKKICIFTASEKNYLNSKLRTVSWDPL